MRAILAIENSGGIGLRGGLPWHIPRDMQLFRFVTSGCKLLAGPRTYDSCKQLDGTLGRKVRVATPDRLPYIDGDGGVIVIGGRSLYEAALGDGLADGVYVTQIRADYPHDVAIDLAWLDNYPVRAALDVYTHDGVDVVVTYRSKR